MEVISNNNNATNTGSTAHSTAWGYYHRYSSLSLASAAASEDYSLAESFHTCYETGEDQSMPDTVTTGVIMTGRVPSFACLEDVQEEDNSTGDTTANDSHYGGGWPSQAIVPLRSYSQLQQQPLSPHLTAARLALSSDFGMLRRPSLDSSSSPRSSPTKLSAQVLLERDHIMTSAALPMSRSFATPRMAVNTAFRTSERSSSFSSMCTAKELEDIPAPPLFVESSSRCYQQRNSNKPLKLENMADDVQLQILSFCSLEDVRALMATNRRYRKLLFTEDAHNLWKKWCLSHAWPQLEEQPKGFFAADSNKKILVDDLSLPTAARPKSFAGDLSDWHQQANLSLLLSMAQSQPDEIDHVQLHEYKTHQSPTRRRRSRRRIHTMDGTTNQPLLHYEYKQDMWMVQFSGRVGQGDRCVRSNNPFPRPTLIETGEWMIPASQSNNFKYNNNSSSNNHNKYNRHHHPAHALLDLFCRSARAVPPPRPAWRPFVAPFLSSQDDAVHLTPRFVSYFEVSILGDSSSSSSSSSDCVAVGVATESFDWHTRMPGWDASSFGYHGDDGGIFHSSGGMLRKFGPSYGRGDVVGCGVDHVTRGIFFSLNGEFLGYGWTGLPMELLEKDMYPVVGIDTNDWIHCNFGTEPFKYDLKSMVVKHEELVHQSLSLASPHHQLTSSVRTV